MENFIYDESNGLWYERQGDYYIPCLSLPEDHQPIAFGGSGTFGTSKNTARASTQAFC